MTIEDKVERLENIRKMDMWIEDLETMRLGMVNVNKQLTAIMELATQEEKLSYCCSAPITETGFCTDCKENC